MEKHETVSTIMAEVRANGSISTKKSSTVTMKIGHRLANDAYGLFLDEQEDKKPETGLIGFRLVAVYEDGKPEPEKSPEEIIIDEIEEKLDDLLEESEPEQEAEPEQEIEFEGEPDAN